MKKIVTMMAWAACAGSAVVASSGVLIEAESFVHKGGWRVDQQFVEQMGSPYLLAHGLGAPVANAWTVASIPAPGTYRVWVRTKNWVPGDWEAPGRFKLIVNGRALDPEFGVEAGWAWQDGGTVAIPSKDVKLELEDLTGFDGRCDAIFLASDPSARPPDSGKELEAWRKRLSGMPEDPPPAGEFDVVIVGGGITGCAAALAAAEQGLTVALVHDRPILGGNASGEVRVHTIGITGYADSILQKINTKHWPNGSAEALDDDLKRHASMDAVPAIRQYLSWRAYGVVMDADRIASVNARHIESGEVLSFTAPVFIDTTGDGWIGYWAGADYRYGREARDEFDESWEEHGDLWSPAKPDTRMMGVSLLWYSEPADAPSSFPDVPWALAVAKDNVDIKGEWFWEYNDDHVDMIDDAEAIRDHLLRAIYGSFANAKQKPEHSRQRLAFVGYVSGKRESRRLMGDYVYTMRDMTEGRRFPDAVATEVREIDLHYQRQHKDAAYPYDFLSTALFMKTPRYFIPFRSLYSRNISNLMMAGRNFSCSHVALGGPRVMNTCGQMGAATGYAAALIKKHKTTPRGIYESHMEELVTLVRPDPAIEEWIDTAPRRALDIERPADVLNRVRGRFPVSAVPGEFAAAVRIVPERGKADVPGRAYTFKANMPVEVYLSVHARGDVALPDEWEKTSIKVIHALSEDFVVRRRFPAGTVAIPGHGGMTGNSYGFPHLAFILPAGPEPAEGLMISDALFAE